MRAATRARSRPRTALEDASLVPRSNHLEAAQGHRSASAATSRRVRPCSCRVSRRSLAEFLSEQHHGDLPSTCHDLRAGHVTCLHRHPTPATPAAGRCHTAGGCCCGSPVNNTDSTWTLPAPGPAAARWDESDRHTAVPGVGAGHPVVAADIYATTSAHPAMALRRDRRRHAQPAGPRAPRAVAFEVGRVRHDPAAHHQRRRASPTRAAHTRPPVRDPPSRWSGAGHAGRTTCPAIDGWVGRPALPARRARFMADRSPVCRRRRASMT